MKGSPTDTNTQLQVLALLARGDTFEQVRASTGLAHATIQSIKKRNPAVLAIIQDKLIDHRITTSRKILSKAQDLIEKKLDKATEGQQVRDDATDRYRNGEIDYDEYKKLVFGIGDISINELNAVARESFNQSQIEQGKPTSITNSPHEAKEDLLRLVEALKAGDEERLLKEVFDRDVLEAEVEDTNEQTNESESVSDQAL